MQALSIALVGYGRMGKQVEAAAGERGHRICTTIDPNNGKHAQLSPKALEGADGVIEFGNHQDILARIKTVSSAGIPMVIGTTAWEDRMTQAREIVETTGGALLYGSNFSIGANVFFRIIEQAAGLINAFDEYDIMMMEYHHAKKTDSPSGTALSIAQKILDANSRKSAIVTEPLQRAIEASELHVGSVRGGSIPGIHSVTLDSPADSITLTHSARNRSGFAMGAVRSLEWLAGKQGFFTVDDFFEDLLGS